MKFKKLIVWLCVAALTIILGCSVIQDAIVPAYIPPTTLDYVGEDDGTSFFPWTTLFDARRIDMKTDFVFALKKIKHGYIKGINAFHITASEQFKAMIFSPTGPIGLLIPAITGGVLGTVLLSKPEDKKKINELEKKVNGSS